MQREIKNVWTGNTIYQAEAESFAALVQAAIKSGADLSDADLSGADLSGADLSGAYLRSAYLRSVYLRSADLRSAYLRSANLRSANLSGADLSRADLRGADLSGANLSGADLSGANLPAPTIVLLAYWGAVSEQLTADLMLLDSSTHPNFAAFDIWAQGGPCPYSGVKVQRIANFTEQRQLWGKGKPDTIYNLMVRVLREKAKTDL